MTHNVYGVLASELLAFRLLSWLLGQTIKSKSLNLFTMKYNQSYPTPCIIFYETQFRPAAVSLFAFLAFFSPRRVNKQYFFANS